MHGFAKEEPSLTIQADNGDPYSPHYLESEAVIVHEFPFNHTKPTDLRQAFPIKAFWAISTLNGSGAGSDGTAGLVI